MTLHINKSFNDAISCCYVSGFISSIDITFINFCNTFTCLILFMRNAITTIILKKTQKPRKMMITHQLRKTVKKRRNSGKNWYSRPNNDFRVHNLSSGEHGQIIKSRVPKIGFFRVFFGNFLFFHKLYTHIL